MAEAKFTELYRVTVTEYDWGTQRIDPNDTKLFTTYEEALAYKKHWDGGSPECYWRAEIEKIA